MDILVKYIDHHADNYQGGSGKSFQFERLVTVSDEIPAGHVADKVIEIVEMVAKASRPYSQQFECGLVIQEMRLL